MQGPEFFICHTIDEVLESKKIVERWPLHMTVIPPFETPSKVDINEILNCISESSHSLGAIKLDYGHIRSGAIPIEIGYRNIFGENNDIPVIEILDPSNKLHELHSSLLVCLGKIGCQFLNFNPEWNGINYSPHATTKSGKTLDKPFFCTTLTLCKKNENTKSIIDTVNLCD